MPVTTQQVTDLLTDLVTIESVITALLGSRQRWQAMKRTGVFAGPVGPVNARRPRAEAAR